ncbi:MAG: hypothetical protein ACTSV7_11360 [Candidatus Baldrarchaeia archaeon]
MWLNQFKVFLRNRYILLGFIVRFLVSPLFAHYYDVNFFVSAGKMLYYQGIITFFIDWWYPVYSYLMFVGFYFPVYLFTDDIFFFGQPFTLLEKFFVKLPSNISDLFIAYILFLIMKKSGKERYAFPVALLYWLNPLTILVSSVWGMFDSVSVVFALLGVYHFSNGRYLLSAFELGVGFGVKLHPIVLLPLFLLLLWREGRIRMVKFLSVFSVPAALSVLPSALVQYNPVTHNYNIGFFPSNLSGILHTNDLLQLFDSNMTYRALLYRFSNYFFYFGTTEGNELILFGILYLLFFLFLHKTRFFDTEEPLGLPRLVSCVSVVYLLYFLSYPRVSQQYFLWVLPFLIVLFAVGKLEKVILLLINFVPFAQTFFRSSFFYFVNQNYANYGVSIGLSIAGGFLFSLSCVFAIQFVFKEEFLNYRSFRKVYRFFEGAPSGRRSLIFASLLASIFLLVLVTVNANGVYWWGYPITFSISLEYLTLPLDLQLVLVLFLFLTLTPLVVSLAPTLRSFGGNARRRRWEIGVLIVALSLFTVLVCIILWVTIPYINTGTNFFFGWVPVFGALRFLCENGGIITSALLLTVCVISLDLLLGFTVDVKEPNGKEVTKKFIALNPS